jgi:acetylornithine deacetylase/succinyl-diaminopimelate desuccinylase-like protein
VQQFPYNELASQLNKAYLTKNLMKMIAIKSENPFDEEPRQGYREKEMGEYLADRMSELGMEVTCRNVLPGRPNVFGTIKGTGGWPYTHVGGPHGHCALRWI